MTTFCLAYFAVGGTPRTVYEYTRMSAGKWAAAGVVVVAFIAAGVAHTTKPRSTAVRPVVAPGDVPAPLPGEWKLLWHDEFDGAALGPAWHAAQYWDEDHTVVGGGELQAYD